MTYDEFKMHALSDNKTIKEMYEALNRADEILDIVSDTIKRKEVDGDELITVIGKQNYRMFDKLSIERSNAINIIAPMLIALNRCGYSFEVKKDDNHG